MNLEVTEENYTLEITDPSGDTLTLTQSDEYELVVSDVGMQGPAGSGTGFSQVFTNQTSVTVTHNLGYRPNVTVVDTAYDQVEGNVEYLSDNSLVVSFSASLSGVVYCS